MSDTTRITQRLLAVLAEEGYTMAAVSWCGDGDAKDRLCRSSGVNCDDASEAVALSAGLVRPSTSLLRTTCIDLAGGDQAKATQAAEAALEAWQEIDDQSTYITERPK